MQCAIRNIFALFIALFLFAIPSAFAQEATKFLNIETNTDTPPLYSIYEIGFDLSREYDTDGRFDPNTIDIQATFAGPNGVEETALGFFKQEASPQWAVRYAPRIAGDYSVTLQLTDSNGETILPDALSFSTSDSINSGFLDIDNNNPARLATSNGDGFVMVGINTAWEDDLYGDGWDMNMDITFDAMQAYNMNFGRVFGGALWTAYFIEAFGTQNERGLIRFYEGMGKYNLEAAADGDKLFQNAQDHGIRFSFVPLEHLAFAPGFQWERNAYNAANGGPCVENICFWTDPTALEYTKRFLRYNFARYGAYTSFGMMELWNEVDNGTHNMWTAETQDDVLSWHEEMDSYWKSLDFYGRPTTTSYAWRDHEWPEDFNQYENTWPAMPYFDVANMHRYPSNFGTVTVETWIDQVDWMNESGGKTRPAFIGEYGVVGESATVRDPNGFYFHDGAWAPFFFAEAAGTNLIWRVDALFRPTSPTSNGYRAFGAFIHPEFAVLPTMTFFAPEQLSDEVQVGKYASNERALLLFRDFAADPTTNFSADQPTADVGDFVLTGLDNGRYLVEFWDTMTGEIIDTISGESTNGELTFTVPPFQRALAAKVYQGELPPTPTPIPIDTPIPTTTATPTPKPTVTDLPTETVVPPTPPQPTNTPTPNTSEILTNNTPLWLITIVGLLIITGAAFILWQRRAI